MPHRLRPIHFSWMLVVFTLILTACSYVSPQSTSSNAHPVQQNIVKQSTPIFIPGDPVTYVALGASDAVGIGSNIPGSQGYVPLVAAHLPKGSHLINLGISGIQLHEALSQELPLALTTSPNLITIWLVANMANLPDLTRLPAFANETPSQKSQMIVAIQKWNMGIAQLAKKYGVALVDLFGQGSQITAHPEYISGDGFHPSPSGYVQLANYFWQVIKGQGSR